MKPILLLPVALLILFVVSCNSGKTSKDQMEKQVDKELEVDGEFMNELHKAKQVFYALPSPIETAMLLKRAGTEYNSDFLNSTDKVSLYTTSRLKALNFGVYGADLSYASLFSQNQDVIQFMAATKQLADDLGIMGFVDADIVERLEKNVTNRDSSMEIISDGFTNSNTYLKESGRPEIAALILAGGWIEGLYIATTLAKHSPNNNELIDRIIDQKLSLNTMLSLLAEYEDNADVEYAIGLVNEIKVIYDQVQVVTSKVEPVTNQEAKITSLQARTEIFISDEVFNRLCVKIDSIRSGIVDL